MNNKVLLNVLGISYSQTQTGAYALVLGEDGGERRIPIIIGGAEAQAIAIELEGLRPPRPLTHDLFHDFAEAYGISVESVLIFQLEEGIFYSKLMCTNGGKRVELDARTSDAIALALRFQCPVHTTGEIMERAGIVFSGEQGQESDEPPCAHKASGRTADLQQLDVAELENLLDDAIASEDYEQASKIRDEIKRRKSE